MAGIIAITGKPNKDTANHMLSKLSHRGPEETILSNTTNSKFLLGEKKLHYELMRDAQSESLPTNSQQSEEQFEAPLQLIIDGEPRTNNTRVSPSELTKMFECYGADFIKHLGDGFAIIFTDGQQLYAARDIFGRKPLYYAVDTEQNMYFASEMKAFHGLALNINIFPPGHQFSTNTGFQKYESLPHFQSKITDQPQSKNYFEKAAELKYLITKAVGDSWNLGKHPAVFLSGGVDSSVVATALSNLTTENIHTFAVGMENSADIINARKVSQYLNSKHIEQLYGVEDMFQVLAEVIYYLESFDVELVNSSIANYLVSQLTRKHGFEIALSGEGADELFGGYHHLKDCATDAQLNKALENLLKGLHNGGLQRVDRMTNAHSLNCRMPFLHADIINFAKEIPCDWKISVDGMEKLILRQAFDNDLPQEVLWRKKAQFGIGSGNEQAMKDVIDEEISDDEYKDSLQDYNLNFKSKEEFFYYKIFKKFFPHPSMTKTVNRWLF